MLSESELTDMSGDGAGSLPDTCSILMAVESSDGMGSRVRTWAVRAALVPCRLSPSGLRSKGEEISSGRLTEVSNWTLALPIGTVVAASDRVVLGGATFEVTAFDVLRSWGIFVRASLVLVQ